MTGMDELQAARDRVDRFLVAFNTIEGELRRRLGAEKHAGYKDLARRFREKNGWWRRSSEAMETIADMRNFLVHEKVQPAIYAAVPSTEVIDLIERIRDELVRPVTVMDRYAREVVEFAPGDALAAVLRVIDERTITFFPVRDGTDFRGLLTTNGIAHWLAKAGRSVGLADLDTPVADVLAAQESEDNVRFVGRTTPVDVTFELFTQHPQLQAVLITHSGKAKESPLGIVTAWDVASAES
jgi:predicted transcriptional regulator